MDDDEAMRRARARERAGRITLEPDDDSALTPEERIDLVVELTRAAWAITGQPWPAIPRAELPVRRRRLGEETS